MNQVGADQRLTENKEFIDFINKTKKRDSLIFAIVLLGIALTIFVGGTYLYRGFMVTSEELAGYRSEIESGKQEIESLNNALDAQQAVINNQKIDLSDFKSYMNEVKNSEINKLMEFAATHREEIDELRKDVDKLKNIR